MPPQTHDLPITVRIALERQRLYALRRLINNPRLTPDQRCELASQHLTTIFNLDPLPEGATPPCQK